MGLLKLKRSRVCAQSHVCAHSPQHCSPASRDGHVLSPACFRYSFKTRRYKLVDFGLAHLEKQNTDEDDRADILRQWMRVSDLPCDVRREGGESLVIAGASLVMLEGKACHPL